MKCPKCGNEMGNEWGKPQCPICGMVEGSQAYIDGVNVLLAEAVEEDEDADVGW